MESPIWVHLNEGNNLTPEYMRLRSLWLVTVFLLCGLSFRIMADKKPLKRYRVLFCNVENLFDTKNDSLTADDEFTPEGRLHWTFKRYIDKQNIIYKTIVAAGEGTVPDIIGFCEVENRTVLTDLLKRTPLSKYPYRIVHANSPDRRGIDVALVYNSANWQLLSQRIIRIKKRGLRTRDILYCRLRAGKDTCHFLVNHWPSRSAGRLETDDDREAAARALRKVTDSLMLKNRMSKILIMGDFNDEPRDASLNRVLLTSTDLHNPVPGSLYNLSKAPEGGDFKGTVKFRGQWSLFDQIIVSGGLLDRKGLHVLPDSYRIFGPAFLLVGDDQYNGKKPNRTYNGMRYAGGFSDHLPVYTDLYAD